MSRLLQAWLSLPQPVRAGVKWSLNACRIPTAGLRRVGGWPMPDDFRPASFHTPPAVERAIRTATSAGLAGDYYEFGLWRGFTFCHAQRIACECGLTEMRFWGFDSFAGLPSSEGAEDEAAYPKESLGRLHAGDFSCGKAQVADHLTQFGVNWSRTTLIEGFYDDTLKDDLANREGMRPVAVALVDCDLYESTVPVLKFLAPLLQNGSIVLFDDWNIFGESDDLGERRAFGEFLKAHPEWTAEPAGTFGWHGQAFTMRRQTGAAH